MSTVFIITILIIATCIFYKMFAKNTDYDSFASYTYDEGTNKVFFLEGKFVNATDSSFMCGKDIGSKAIRENLVKGRKLKKEIDEIVNKVFQGKNHSKIKCKTTLYPCREDGMYTVRGIAYEVLDLEELKNNKEFNEKISQLNKLKEELNALHKKDYLEQSS